MTKQDVLRYVENVVQKASELTIGCVGLTSFFAIKTYEDEPEPYCWCVVRAGEKHDKEWIEEIANRIWYEYLYRYFRDKKRLTTKSHEPSIINNWREYVGIEPTSDTPCPTRGFEVPIL